VSGAQNAGADSLVAFSYPPGSFAITQAAQTADFNPAVFYVGVGGAFPIFPQVANGKQQGVTSIGGVDAASPAMVDNLSRHTQATGAPPDGWASAVTYASLQILQEAIARVGLDHAALASEIGSGTFDPVLGEVQLEDSQLRTLWWAGQWQGQQFVAISPTDRAGAATPIIPKPAW
jgi:branched-chain amino acid transport system substrate-binding protein